MGPQNIVQFWSVWREVRQSYPMLTHMYPGITAAAVWLMTHIAHI